MQLQINKLSQFKLNLPVFTKPLISNRNRLEGLPRTDEFNRSLRAEIADPLWLLCRQWQVGEFEGEDAATACQAKILAEHQQPQVIHFNNQGNPAEYDANKMPLETLIEGELPRHDYYLSVQMGRQFFKLMSSAGLSTQKKAFITQYPIAAIQDADDMDAMYLFQSTSGAFPDGYKIWEDINNDKFETFIKTIPGISAGDTDKFIQVVASQFSKWFTNLYHLPAPGQTSWRPDRMEYNFELDLPHVENDTQSFLEATQYSSGRIDWLTFDESLKEAPGQLPADNFAEVVQSFIPTALKYSGMPNPRFWQMENSRVDFGKIQTGTSGLLSILLAEYGLTYSNDWFVLPYQLQSNTLCEVKCIMVTDVFGQNILIEPTFKDPEMNWHEFACFRHTELKNRPSPRNRFYLPSSVVKTQYGEPLEKVNFMRDEMANMVWAIESIAPSEAGGSRRVKSDLSRYDVNFVPTDPDAKIRYLIGTSVPKNWIPFIPVHKQDNVQEIRLQRAKIPNAPAPLTLLLREQQPVHFIEEEEVPRAGVIVTRMYKRTRWLNGQTYLWIGRRKATGRGEGWSGLMFDQILSV